MAAPAKKSALKEAFAAQAKTCQRRGSPFTALICHLFASKRLPRGLVTSKLEQWPAKPGLQEDHVPLRMASALHALVLEKKSAELTALYPVNTDAAQAPTNPEKLWIAITNAMAEHKLFLLARLAMPLHSDDVRHCLGLIGVVLTLAEHTGLPLVISELGTRAGLNLHLDKYRFQFGDEVFADAASDVSFHGQWQGKLPATTSVRIIDRAGCGLNPLQISDRVDQQRLLASVWPDQHDHMATTRAALRVCAASGTRLESPPAARWLAKRLAASRPDSLHIVIHTSGERNLHKADIDECLAQVTQAGAQASPQTPIAWLQLDAVSDQSDFAAMKLTLWPKATTYEIGRVDCYARKVRWAGWPA